MEVHAEFTESVKATTPSPCDRHLCKALIQPGEERYYVHNKQFPEKPGKYVCKNCFQYYTSNTRTSLRPTATREAQSVSRIDVTSIRKSVNESQRKGAHTPQGRTTALPPNFPGPSIATPHVIPGSMINGQFVPQAPTAVGYPPGPAPPPIIGYSAAHAQHSQATQDWAKRAATGFKGILGGKTENKIPCNFEVYQPEMGPKGKPVSLTYVKESARVSNDISSYELRKKIMDEIRPPLIIQLGLRGVHATAEVIERLVVRETTGGTWARVDPDDTSSYFGSRFLVASSSKKSDFGPVFRAPAASKGPLVFGVVLSQDLWSKIVEREELEFMSQMNSMLPGSPNRVAAHNYQFNTISRPQANTVKKPTAKRVTKRTLEIEESASSDSDIYMPESIIPKKVASRPRTRTTSAMSSKTKKSRSEPTVDNEEESQIGTAKRPIIFEDSDSDQQTSGPAPPSQKSSTALSTATHGIPRSGAVFVPLKPETLSRGFQRGGSGAQKESSNDTASQLVSESILFFPLPNKTFLELMEDPNNVTLISILPEGHHHFHAHLTYNPSPKVRLGKGSFKVAIAADLEFHGMRKPLTGLGSLATNKSSSVSVALKRPFINAPPIAVEAQSKNEGGGPARLKRKELLLSYSDEKQAISGEANLLVWANALLKYSYEFIVDQVDARTAEGEDLPEYIEELPAFRFVEAGVAIATKSIDKEGSSKMPTSHRAVYLLEEMLPGVVRKDFMKYINNSKAIPLLSPEHPDYYLAEFLSFLQHIQYQITHKLSYISDFQGVGTTLTDPQIMTSPELGAKLFGGGNLGDAFECFPKEHICNKYCEWFALEDLHN